MRGWLDPCDRGLGPSHLQARPVLAGRACAYAGFASCRQVPTKVPLNMPAAGTIRTHCASRTLVMRFTCGWNSAFRGRWP